MLWLFVSIKHLLICLSTKWPIFWYFPGHSVHICCARLIKSNTPYLYLVYFSIKHHAWFLFLGALLVRIHQAITFRIHQTITCYMCYKYSLPEFNFYIKLWFVVSLSYSSLCFVLSQCCWFYYFFLECLRYVL